MEVVARCSRSPEQIIMALERSLCSERGNDWAHGQYLSSTEDRVYCRVVGTDFEVSRKAGVGALDAIASGSIHADGRGAIVRVTVRYGIAPAVLPKLLFLSSATLVAIVTFSLWPLSATSLWVFSMPVLAGYFWWFKQWEGGHLLKVIANAVGGLDWREV